MQEQHTHGILTTKPPAQTYCGLPTDGHKVTDDPFSVTCPECKRLMKMTTNMFQTRGPGRPKKRSIFG